MECAWSLAIWWESETHRGEVEGWERERREPAKPAWERNQRHERHERNERDERYERNERTERGRRVGEGAGDPERGGAMTEKNGGARSGSDGRLETATLGGGCFWCIEAVMKRLAGVEEVASGYAGGHVENPSYGEVCGGSTGHAEVVQVHFDPGVVSYRDLLEVFFTVHDPTTPNRQGADVGPQYRSIILFHSDEQRKVAQETIRDLEEKGLWDDPVVTEVEPLDEFYRAEEHHQDYFEKNPRQAYCQAVVAPKVAKLRKKHADKLKPA